LEEIKMDFVWTLVEELGWILHTYGTDTQEEHAPEKGWRYHTLY
jgi:hypothetical protein